MHKAKFRQKWKKKKKKITSAVLNLTDSFWWINLFLCCIACWLRQLPIFIVLKFFFLYQKWSVVAPLCFGGQLALVVGRSRRHGFCFVAVAPSSCICLQPTGMNVCAKSWLFRKLVHFNLAQCMCCSLKLDICTKDYLQVLQSSPKQKIFIFLRQVFRSSYMKGPWTG